MRSEDLRYLVDVLRYQFGEEVAEVLSKALHESTVWRSPSTERIRNVYLNGKLLLVLRAQDNLFSLTPLSGELLAASLPWPKLRVVVREDVAKFIAEGRDVFCRHVVEVDRSLRGGDEAVAVSETGKLLAVGRMNVSGEEVRSYKRGVALSVRRGYAR
ncbi:hypothetical protein HS1genome_0366 [Sulfodiicoccus acidiphilus]|uniref:PUA domain-containing protein n=1 Tax=Sulfodiicoccus acidiphilus TaxID=1670455 RepID=A0A348B1C5_9CREN|nr:PUA domain-containing protein [Sulfodiicoccus acidiphilus]BBD71977.1 hypothetical protein HS1genome_0366 [Sulfodiicoccus acidiphilus]GGT91888.1 hypothetical protein GCM10007116_07040 [Sulfodiicoccus acidiphilus]